MDLYYFNKYGNPQQKRVRVDHVTWNSWSKSWTGIHAHLQNVKDRYLLNSYTLVDIKSVHDSTKKSPYLVENSKRIEHTHSINKDWQIESTKTVRVTPLFSKTMSENAESSLSRSSSSFTSSMSRDDPKRARAIEDVPFNPRYQSTFASNHRATTRDNNVSSRSAKDPTSGQSRNTTLQLENEFLEASGSKDEVRSHRVLGSIRGNKRIRTDTENARPRKKSRQQTSDEVLVDAVQKFTKTKMEIERRKLKLYEEETDILQKLLNTLGQPNIILTNPVKTTILAALLILAD